MKFIIYGPPAAGKSSFARFLPSRIKDASVIHLEKVRTPFKIQLLNALHGIEFRKPLFVTAAELEPKDFPSSFDVIFLMPVTVESYRSRYNARNQIEPGKASQNEEETYAGMSGLRDHHPELFRCIVDPIPYEGDWDSLLDVIAAELGLEIDLRPNAQPEADDA